MTSASPIGIFDSGFGGLTVLQEIERLLPSYDYLYLGDNARAPYGNRSFETVHTYTLQAVEWLFGQGCYIVILACNTASAKALRTIQQNDLPRIAPDRRVLGVIRPVTEYIGTLTSSGHIGILGTVGTIESRSYVIEIEKYFPLLTVTQEACPMWVPLVENGEADHEGADYFVRQHIKRLFGADPLIDTIVLGCTHYPLLERKIRKFLPSGISVVSQGAIVARSLESYLTRHRELAKACSQRGTRSFFTSEKAPVFERLAAPFYGRAITCREMRFP
jgi:glutamate racemase